MPSSTPVSTQSYDAEEVRRQPGAQEDVLRAVSIAPGVGVTSAGRNDLIVRGGTQTHILNGHVMSMVIDDDAAARHPEGKIGVQVHVGPPMKVEYRNFRVRQP